MIGRLLIIGVLVSFSVVSAFAAPPLKDRALVIANAHDDAYDNASWKGGCDVKKALSLYEDDAIAVYPGEGEVANSKAEIEKLIENFIKPYCGKGHDKPPTVANYKLRALQLDPNYIMIVRTADVGDGADVGHFRATELIHKSAGKWRYVVDHASIGVPPEASSVATPAK